MEEQDARSACSSGLIQHARATAQYNVYFGRGRDRFDVRGRVAHESLFNVANGTYRGPSTQQGYSPFTTWTRGLAWAMLGFAEELEFLATLPRRRARAARRARSHRHDSARRGPRDVRLLHRRRDRRGRRPVLGRRRAGPWRRSATGATRPADPFNDTSRSTVRPPRSPRRGCCGSVIVLATRGLRPRRGGTSRPACRSPRRSSTRLVPISVAIRIIRDCVLHSVYHWPNGWDHVPPWCDDAAK